MIAGLVLGVLLTLLVVHAIADVRAGVWDRDRPQRLDITTALARHRRLEQVALERRALEVEDKVLRERRPEAN